MGNSKKRTKIALVIIFLLALVGVAVYFIFFSKGEDEVKNNENDTVQEESNDDERVTSKSIKFNVDDLGQFVITADVTLSEGLKLTEQLDILVKAYNENGKLLHTYIASSRYFIIDSETEIHLGFNDFDGDDFAKISYITTEISVNEKTVESNEEYEFVVNEEPEVVDYVSLYRVFMDLSDYYYTNSGLALVEYEDGTSFIERISYLPDKSYIGIADEENFGVNNNGSNISKVSVYRIAYLWEQ